MPATWTISWFPPCEYHVFLSHCAEDRGELIFPVYEPQMGDMVSWAADRIEQFVTQEEIRSVDLATTLEADTKVRNYVEGFVGLAERVRAVYPRRMIL